MKEKYVYGTLEATHLFDDDIEENGHKSFLIINGNLLDDEVIEYLKKKDIDPVEVLMGSFNNFLKVPGDIEKIRVYSEVYFEDDENSITYIKELTNKISAVFNEFEVVFLASMTILNHAELFSEDNKFDLDFVMPIVGDLKNRCWISFSDDGDSTFFGGVSIKKAECVICGDIKNSVRIYADTGICKSCYEKYENIKNIVEE